MPATKKAIYSHQFAMLCLSSLFFASSFTMIIPELPSYLSSLGGAEYKGLIVSLFTLTAAISRPFSGKLADMLGRVPMMAVGSAVCLICAFLYPVFGSVFGFFFLRLMHGFSTGFRPTAALAYAAERISKKRIV
ncbi:MFS family permease [Flavobacterium nitrogenifigens]|uniref:MFS family permease n=2 Tax=Flavobacterium TaxID=237 RepID=A0A7W7IXV8_9FLAO|nr:MULTISPECIES: MFS transporter [Flavobacterium]MBB4802122.1 MFS family permease [Flavobacterium nitrogenifigens]MBB6387080.1 MFS family permease [Flavobacterium notoginsengisoli]